MNKHSHLLELLKRSRFLFIALLTLNMWGGHMIETQASNKDSISIMDRFGNAYTASSLQKSGGGGGVAPCTTANGLFEITFADNPAVLGFDDPILGPARWAVVCQVYEDLSHLIVPENYVCGTNPDPLVSIEVREMDQPASGGSLTLGTASSLYMVPIESVNHTGILDGEVWKTIMSGHSSDIFVNSGSDFHGIMTINFTGSLQWHTELDPAVSVPGGELDLYSVVLHEAIHALGFASFIDDDGQSRYTIKIYSPGGVLIEEIPTNYYTRYDTRLELSNGTPILFNPTPTLTPYDWNFNPAIPSPPSTVTSSCDGNPPSILFNYDNTEYYPIYGPDPYEDGSSVSHIEINCGGPTSEFVMNPMAPGAGNMRREITQEEVNVLCQLGYDTNTSYGEPGTPNVVAPLTACSETEPVGFDDFDLCCTEETLTLSRCPGAVLTIDDALHLMCNDNSNVTSVAGLELIIPETGVNLDPATNELTLIDPSIPDNFVILRYVPVNGAGQFGNITYVVVALTHCPTIADMNIPDCAPDPFSCNLLCNPYAEISSGCDPIDAQNGIGTSNECIAGWGTLHATPGYYTPASTSVIQPIDVNVFMMAAGLSGAGWAEAIITPISVLPGNRYVLSYLVTRRHNFTTSPSDEFVARLTNLDAIEAAIDEEVLLPGIAGNSEIPLYPLDPGALPTYVPDYQEISYVVIPELEAGEDPVFKQVIVCFEAEEAWEYLYFQPLTNISMFMAHPVLMEDNLFTDMELDVECGETTVTLGEEIPAFCDELGAPEYEWFDPDGNSIGTGSTELTIPTPSDEGTYVYTLQVSFAPLNDPDGNPYELIGEYCGEVTVTVNVPYCCDPDPTNECHCLYTQIGTYDEENGYIATTSATWTPTSNPINTSGPLRINGDLLIDEDVVIHMQGLEIHFGPQGRIVVAPKGVLYLEKDPVTGATTILTSIPDCEAMWQGIRVIGPGNNVGTPLPGDYGFVYSSGGTRIERAVIGIAGSNTAVFDFFDMAAIPIPNAFEFWQAPSSLLLEQLWLDPTTPNTTNGYVQASDSEFINCFQGINLPYWDGGLLTNVSTNNLYLCDEDLVYPFNTVPMRTEAGISLSVTEKIISLGDVFSNLNYGIRANHVIEIEALFGTYNQNCGVGVSARRLSGNKLYNARIINNTFETCNIAVQFDGVNGTVRFNNINTQAPSTNYAWGLITGPLGIPQLIPTAGILMRGSDYNIADNLIDNVSYGMVLWDSEAGLVKNNSLTNGLLSVYVLGDNPATIIECNAFKPI